MKTEEEKLLCKAVLRNDEEEIARLLQSTQEKPNPNFIKEEVKALPPSGDYSRRPA